jgi:hypothetical protein
LVGNRTMSTSRFWLLLLLVCTLAPPSFAASRQVQADRNPVGMDETFQLTYSTADDVDADPDFLALTPYVEILNRSKRSNISVINGLVQSTRSWTLTLMPKKTGKATLPAISFGNVESPPFELMVLDTVRRQDEQKELFARIEFDQTKLYMNQQLVVTHTLLSATNLTSYDLGELKFTGVDAVIEPLGDAKQYTRMVGQSPFLVIEQRYAVFPLESGTMNLELVSSTAEQAVTRGSFYLPFGGPPKILRARAGGRRIEVLPIPDSANMNPWLPAHGVELSERWDTTPVKFVVGEPVTRTLSLKAEGIAAAQLPDLSTANIDGMKLYPDQPKVNDIKNDTGITGYSVQKVAYIPLRAGRMELPAVEVPWWNLSTNQREVAKLPAQTIEVMPASNPPVQSSAAQPDAQAAPPAEVEPAPAQDSAEPSGSQLLAVTSNSSPWFFVSMLLTFGWLMTLLAWYIKSGRSVRVARGKKPSSDAGRLKAALQKMAVACDERDALACRGAILAWARLYLMRPEPVTVQHVAALLAPDAAVQLRNIDAMLYGGAHDSIDFECIKKGVEALMSSRHDTGADASLTLEPLYRS